VWLESWVAGDRSPSADAADMEAMLRRSNVEDARRSRAVLAAMSVEERRAMGLPDEGWEELVWGGIGLEDDDGDTKPGN
jgi:hypothetical protein